MGVIPGLGGFLAALGAGGSGGGGGSGPTFVGVSTSNGDESGYLGSETIAAALQNDIAIAVHVNTTAKASTGGWTQIATAAFGSGVDVTLLWRRVASNGENYISDFGAISASYGTKFIVFRGCPTGSSPVDTSATQSEATGTSVSHPTVTTTQASDLILLVSVHSLLANSASYTNAALGTITEHYDATPKYSFHLASALKATAGATGTTAMTLSSSRTHLDMTLALKGA